MFFYDTIYLSKGIDPAKKKSNKQYTICHYWFFNHGFEFKDSVCNDCHDLIMLCLNIFLISLLQPYIIVVLFIA